MKTAKEAKKLLSSQHYRDFLIFYSALFFTCVVGIIELLPEFENWSNLSGFTAGISYRISVSILYFGLLFGIVYSISKCFQLYSKQSYFRSPEVDCFLTGRGRIWRRISITGMILIFTLLYLAKTGLL